MLFFSLRFSLAFTSLFSGDFLMNLDFEAFSDKGFAVGAL
jgi:hypothetical protein